MLIDKVQLIKVQGKIRRLTPITVILRYEGERRISSCGPTQLPIDLEFLNQLN